VNAAVPGIVETDGVNDAPGKKRSTSWPSLRRGDGHDADGVVENRVW